MNIILYSLGGSASDKSLDLKAASFLGASGTLTYIPSRSGAVAERYYRETQEWYRPHGVTKFNYFPVDVEIKDSDLARALSSEAIFLSGGNTFAFLNTIKQQGLISRLVDFAKSGGLLIGLSAGAIIMTPTIKVAAMLPDGGDANDVGLTDLSGLGLVNFEFAPHHVPGNQKLLDYSTTTDRPIYACPNGTGISIFQECFSLHGPITCLFRGAAITSYCE